MLARITASLLLFVSMGALAALPDYQYIEVYTGGGSTANDVSNAGVVVGCYSSMADGSRVAFKWENNHRTDLGPGCATKIGDTGLIAGYDANYNFQFWTPSGSLIPVGLNAFSASITGINRQEIASGWWIEQTSNGTSVTHGFLWQNGQRTDLPDGCGYGINDSNQVLCNGGVWKDGVITPFPTLSDGNQFHGAALANNGDSFGRMLSGFGYYNGATGTVQSVPYGDKFSGAIDLNSNRTFIGDTEGLFGWVGDLTGMRAISTADFPKIRPTSINELGWITGVAQTTPGSTGSQGAVLLVPKTAAPPMVSVPGQPLPGLPVMKHPRTDFNGDIRNDLIWRASSGEYGAWLMDGNNIAGSGFIAAPANATLRFRGDFNADNRTDLVFQDASGAWWITLMNGMSATSTKILDGGMGWNVVGVGDFDGDGRTDLLWYHPTQGFGVWLMNGAAAMSYGPTAFPNHGWPAAIGAFSGRGHDDIAWIGDDGHLELYTMNGVNGSPAGTIRDAGSGFVPAFVANFNGDFHDDIVWKHPDGRYSLWLMDGATTVNSTSLLGAGSGWHVIGTPDFDGNGTADLLFRADDGSVGGWLMSGTTQTSYALFLGGGSGWDIVIDAGVSSDFKDDLLWRYRDGSYGLWLMNGLTPTSTQVVLQGGTGWELVP